MQRGFYTAASGVLSQERTLNVLTNNIANVKTPGYRASRVVSSTFEQELLTRMEGDKSGRIGKGAPVRLVSEVPVRFDTSSLEETGRPFDVAIDGEGFFNVQAPEDPEGNEGALYLTRDGGFDLDGEGRLTLPGVGLVLGQKGPIELEGSAGFTVDPDGSVYDDRGRYVDSLLVTCPPQDARVERAADGLFTAGEMDANQPAPEATKLAQGWVERSNVDLNREYTLVMEAQRAFQACSTALQIIDKVDQKAASQIAAL